MSLDDSEDFEETVQREPVFDELDDAEGVSSPTRPSPSPPASAEVTFIGSFEEPAEAEPVDVDRSLPRTVEMEEGALPAQGGGEDEYGATVLDGFSREPGSGASSAPSVIGKRPQARPLGPPAPQSDAPLYVALVAIVVLIVGLVAVIVASVIA